MAYLALPLAVLLLGAGPVSAASRAALLCNGHDAKGGGFWTEARTRPSTCWVNPRNDYPAPADLHHLHWRHWGTNRATAVGVVQPSHALDGPFSVNVRAYGLRRARCGSALRVYSRLRITFRHRRLKPYVVRPTTCFTPPDE